MPKITTTTQNGNQLFNSYNTKKFLLGFNSFITGSLTASGADVATLQGMVMGRIAATNKIVPLDKDAADGSQYPVGICIIDKTVDNGDTETLTLVNKGRVASSIINFADTETLDTVVGTKTLRDWLNDLGLILEGGTELTKIDNS